MTIIIRFVHAVLFILCIIPQNIFSGNDYYWSDKRKIKINEDKSSLVLVYKEGHISKNIESLYEQKSGIVYVKISPDKKITRIQFELPKIESILETLKELDINLTDLEWYSFGYKYENGHPLAPTNKISFLLKSEFSLPYLEQIVNNRAMYYRTHHGTLMLNVVKPDVNVLSLANEIYESGIVEYCHPDFIADISRSIDPLYQDQYYLNNTGQFGGTTNIDINAPEAWSYTTGSTQIKVAVIDDGVEAHEDLNDQSGISRVLGGFTPATGGNGNPYLSTDTHGEACAGIIAASHNEVGIRGIAPNVKILPVNIFAPNTNSQEIADGISWAWENGADVLSNSWGYNNPNAYFDNIATAIQDARLYGRNGKGAIVVFAGGNGGFVGFPSNVSGVISVGAIDKSGNRWYYSAWGPRLDVVAPSGDVNWNGDVRTLDRMGSYGKYSGNYMTTFGGTSAACPQVAGAAALLLSYNSTLTENQVTSLLKLTTDDMGTAGNDNDYGYGRINAQHALMILNNQSLNTTASAFNGGRRLIRGASDYYHLVYASGSSIVYRRKYEYSGNWENPIILSKTSGDHKYPSIAKYNNYVYVTWQKKTSTNTYDIHFAASSDNGITWNDYYNYVVTTVQYTIPDPLPLIECDGYTLFLYFAKFDGIRCYLPISSPIFPNLYNNWISIANLGGLGATTPTATINSGLHSLVYRDGWGSIQFKYYNGGWYPYGEINLSSIVPGGGSHLTPSLTSIPGTSQMHVAWKKLIGSGSSIYDHLIVHRRSTNYNTWPNEWFGTYYNSQELPSITGLATNKVDLLYQTPSQFGNQSIYRMRFNGTNWGVPTYIANNTRYPSVSSSNTTARYVWTSGSTSPYTVNYSSVPLTKETEVDPKSFYLRSIALLDSSGNYIELKIHTLGFRLNDGTIQRMEYSKADLTSFSLTNANAWDSLGLTSLSTVPGKVNQMILDYSIEGMNVNNIANITGNNLSVVLNILDSRNNLLMFKSENYTAVSNQINLSRKEITIPINTLNYTPLKVSVKINNLIPKEETFASLGHIFDYTQLALNDKIENKFTKSEKETIKNLTIKNYPNPFNPTTKFDVTIPSEGRVSLRIYDVLGRELAELVNSKLNTGNYEFQFDASTYPTGVYIYRLELVGEKPLVNKMLLIK